MNNTGPILIVDDDVDDHFIFREVANSLGLINPLMFFRGGHELFSYLHTTLEKPFIIFCDINMPLMSGLELRRVLYNDERLRQKSIPFVFFTTAASEAQVREAYNLTVQGFFLKASNFDEIKKMFRLILEYWDTCKHPNSI